VDLPDTLDTSGDVDLPDAMDDFLDDCGDVGLPDALEDPGDVDLLYGEVF